MIKFTRYILKYLILENVSNLHHVLKIPFYIHKLKALMFFISKIEKFR